jgi:polar amino acid transport system substrate-binding protein
MSRTAFKLCVAMAAASIVVSAQTTQLRLVSTVWPPFTDGTGRPRFALDLVEAALDRSGVKSQTTFIEPAQFTPQLLTGSFDGSAAVWKDAEREKALLFSQAYLENRLILVARSGGDVSATTLANLKGRRIALVEGYSYSDALESSGAVLVRSKGEEDSVRLLLSGGVDYTLMDELVVNYIVDNHAKEARTKLQFGARPLLIRPLYFAIRRDRADAKSLVDRFNTQLRAMIIDRTYHRLLHVDWIRTDVDGDGLPEIVASSDRPGPTEPQRSYDLFSTTQPAPPSGQPTPKRYFFGGAIYNGWSSVPDQFKVADSRRPDPNRPVAKIFTFTW